jgi:hypothetical protein
MVEQSSQNQNQGYGVHDFISEGDAPSYLHLFDFTGLRSSEDPSWGEWGGRFSPNATGWIDTEDDFPYTEPGGLGTYLTPRRATRGGLRSLQLPQSAGLDSNLRGSVVSVPAADGGATGTFTVVRA